VSERKKWAISTQLETKSEEELLQQLLGVEMLLVRSKDSKTGRWMALMLVRPMASKWAPKLAHQRVLEWLALLRGLTLEQPLGQALKVEQESLHPKPE
jgi:hypothetical protein